MRMVPWKKKSLTRSIRDAPDIGKVMLGRGFILYGEGQNPNKGEVTGGDLGLKRKNFQKPELFGGGTAGCGERQWVPCHRGCVYTG